MGVNNLPKVATWQQRGRESNSQPLESQVPRPNHYTIESQLIIGARANCDRIVRMFVGTSRVLSWRVRVERQATNVRRQL